MKVNPFSKLPLIPALIGLISLSQGGLEEQYHAIQKAKAQELHTLTPSQIDSMANIKSLESMPQTKPFTQNQIVLDSLIQGPIDLDSLAADTADSAITLPKRYSQRIFSTSPGTLFSSTFTSTGRSHILGPGDEITLSLWGDKEKEYLLILNTAGKVFLEGVGLVTLGDLSVKEAESKLRKKLSRIYSGIQKGTAHVEISNTKPGPIKVFILGEVESPGGFVFASNTSLLSAFYHAKGPTDIGTVRNVKLTRGNKEYFLDLYEYLLMGNSLSPNNLQDGDILFVERAKCLVEVEGDVGRPAIYELKPDEGVKELLAYAGHLNPTAANQKITAKRIFPDGRMDYLDVPPPREFFSGSARFKLHNGDHLFVEKSSEISRDFVSVTGPVKYEGSYQIKGLKNVSDLVEKAGGLKEEAFPGRVHVLRFNPDGSSQLFSHSLENTEMKTIELQGRDHVILYSKKDMYAPDSLEIAGAVNNPGRYLYSAGLSVKDLILRAGGVLPSHEKGRAICFRPKLRERKVESHIVTLESGLKNIGNEFELQARDFVLIPFDPNWYSKEIVVLAGQFKYPGKYALLHPEEKLNSVITRAGGLKEYAYVPGFRFFRNQNNIGRVGVDLKKARANNKSDFNVSMMGGDSLYIPEKQMTVKVIGEVGFPTAVLHKKGKGVKYYISRAGGFTRLSDKKRMILEYANGETSGDFYRNPDPGSVIYVPDKPEPEPIKWFEGVNAILGTLTIGASLILSIQAIKN